MFIKIPDYRVADFTFARFVAHIVDHSPVYETRSQQRLGCKALDAIDAATDGVAELGDDACKLLQQAAELAPVPRLFLSVPGGEPQHIPARAYAPYYEAIEQATAERPAKAEPEATEPQAAE